MTKTTESLTFVIQELMAAIRDEKIDVMVIIEDEKEVTIVSNACVACMAETLAEYMEGKGIRHLSDTGSKVH